MEFQHSLLDVISWGNQWLHCTMSAVFPVYFWTHLYMYDIHSTANGITWCWMPFNPSTMPWLSFQLLLSTEIVSKDCNNFMIKFNMNLWKTYYLNFGVKNYMKVDHRSYRRNFCNCKKKDWNKNIQACTGFEPLTSVIPVQRSYKLSYKQTGSRSLYVNCGVN